MAKDGPPFKTGSCDAVVIKELRRLAWRIDSVTRSYEEILGNQREILGLLRRSGKPSLATETETMPDAMALLDLPSSLRKTALAIYKLRRATAQDLSRETDRLRAVESSYANQLVRMGYLKKKRLGRKVVFCIDCNRVED